ncbi:T9SS type A sorting domain-containing protein [Bacteroidota bacterium]
MKKYYQIVLVVSSLLFSSQILPCNGQWYKHVIDNNLNTAVSIDAADLIGDPKTDLLVTNYTGKEIILYENNSPDWTKNIIDEVKATFAYFGDVDNDDTLDVVALIWAEDKLVWYENNHPTWTKHIIDEDTETGDWIQVLDMNGDDTLDVIVSSGTETGNIIWYENKHPDWIEHTIDGSNVVEIKIDDIDGDGLLDIAAAAQATNDVLWFKNEDNGLTWTKYIIDDTLINAFGLDIGDIDGDGLLDIAVTTGGPYYVGKEVVWYKNSLPTWTKYEIDLNLSGATRVEIEDVDGNDTMDIIAGGFKVNDVVWYENKHPTWDKHVIDSNLGGPRGGIYIDIDGDQIKDVVFVGESTLAWYRQHITSVPQYVREATATFYPNPSYDHITIEKNDFDPFSIEINSMNGQRVYSDRMEGNSKQIDLSTLSKGIYFITLRSKEIVRTEKLIKW